MSDLKLKPCPKAFDDFYRSKFFTGDDLVGKKPIYTIVQFYQTELKPEEDGETQTVIVAKLKETPLMLKINYTNACSLKAMFGAEFKMCEGKRIVITAERERVGNEQLNTVRIYGSPDLKEDLHIEIKMPFRKNPVKRTLYAPKRQEGAQQQPAQQPAQKAPATPSTRNDDPDNYDRSA